MEIMERPTDNIKNPKIRAYMENVTEGKPNVEKISGAELEEGMNQFIQGLDKTLAEADEMIARHRLGEIPEAISFSYIAKKYFGKSRGWLMQKLNGNKVNGKQASFTDGERQQFREALQDLSKKLSAAAMIF
ncbi:MAG: DUF5053 domain-containing protein [Prevotella sp.]|nr:DUF5053 domain-containing protein [Prevotella sp.]